MTQGPSLQPPGSPQMGWGDGMGQGTQCHGVRMCCSERVLEQLTGKTATTSFSMRISWEGRKGDTSEQCHRAQR